MKKIIGYAISIIGIAIMTIGFNKIQFGWKLLATINPNYISGIGITAIIIGIIISLRSETSGKRKNEDGKKEVPIYEGVGGKRKIIGYRKD